MDLADPEASQSIQGTGQSGQPISRGYASFNPRWQAGDRAPMQRRPEPARLATTLQLQPAR